MSDVTRTGAPLRRMRKLVLFDIDGTMLRGHGAGGRAMRRAAERVLGERCRGAPVDFGGGSTRRSCASSPRTAATPSTTRPTPPSASVYRRAAGRGDREAERRIEALPGVLALLARMRQERPAILGLLTGNYPETAAIKLRAVGHRARTGSRSRPGAHGRRAAGAGAGRARAARRGARARARDRRRRHRARRALRARERQRVRGGLHRRQHEPPSSRAAGAHLVLENLRDPEPLLQAARRSA